MESSLRGCFLIHLKLHVVAQHNEVYDSTMLQKVIRFSNSQDARAAKRIDDLHVLLALGGTDEEFMAASRLLNVLDQNHKDRMPGNLLVSCNLG